MIVRRQPATATRLVDAVAADAASLGFEVAQSVTVPERQSEVA